MTKRMIIMLAIVGVIFGGIFSFKAFINHMINDFFDNMPEETATITAAEVLEDRWSRELSAVGSFRAINGANLTTEVGGIVTGIHFSNGDEVTEGQRLVSLDIETDEADLDRLKAAESLTKVELDRYQRLYREGNISQSELQRRESEAAQASASVRAQQARIRQKTIRAPFDGISGIRQVNLGQYVSPGSAVVSVQALDPIYLNFTLPERRLAEIQPGQPVSVSIDAYPDEYFEGEITAIEPAMSESTRTFTAQATLANPDHKLRPGMFGRAVVTMGEPRVVNIIPQTAVQFNPYGNSVYIIREDDEGTERVSQRFVRTGERRGDLVEVLEGLEQGDKVATSGLLKLRNQAPVAISDNGDMAPSADVDPRPRNQ
ncbi:efflux RND transporter periplasmic adaptor subunit [Marinimicrobium alkaliphilum]|uniref:efflux RND transporter periplasmic adaptor subunit n=1 Tax=Marinimicrobium alkaliphilum TaxID=2202654 RepID=UPI000DB9A762|nr:efflux RND transporter periplasmic adaptor subunit [Marinimicrobium alkaliphilum]